MSDIREKIANLTPEQRAELLKKLDLKKSEKLVSQNIQRTRQVTNTIPLSFAQQRLWFLEQLEGPSSNYNIPFALRLRGQLKKSVLSDCFNEIIKRHDILRTHFITVGNEPTQVIDRELILNIDCIQIDESQVSQYATIEAHDPFDLSAVPLLRVKLLELRDDDHILLITMHHIISDGWSTGILVRELSMLYNIYLNGKEPNLQELLIQYSDFAQWQHDYLQGHMLDMLLGYWKNQLEGLPPLLEMPTDYARPAVQTYPGAIHKFTIDRQLTDNITQLGMREGATLFMTTLSAFYILLYKYSKQNDITIGTTIANRNHKEIEGLIGFFVNTLVLRASLSHDKSFHDFLSEVKSVTLSAYEHQDLPFDKLVTAIQPERSLAHSPLFQVMFELQNTPIDHIQLGEIDVTIMEQELHIAKFDLTLSFYCTDDGLTGVLEYNTDLFQTETISRFAEHYSQLLKSIVSNPHNKISELSILSPQEWDQLIVQHNQLQLNFPLNTCFQELFEEQVNKTPNNIAASCNGKTITYYELNRKANQLAHHLLASGAKTDLCVALLVDRGIDYLISMIGVFKAGAAFVPLDPNAKDKRTQDIIEQCNPIILLASAQYLIQANELIEENKIVCFDDESIDQFPHSKPDIQQIPNSLAYVIYTSGSTGKPKGAMLEHKGMINHLYGKITDLNITEHDVIGQIAVQTFDVAVWQFLCPLLIGGRTAIFTGDHAWDPKLLLAKINEENVTILESVPSHTKVILDEQEARGHEYNLQSLRIYITNGEPLTPEQCIRWFQFNPRITLVNAYGATECSDDSHHLHITQAPVTTMPYMPVRQPLPNQQTYILDESLEPVPIGVRGEIYFGGSGVGRGYLNDPERTAQRFLPNPFSKEPGERLYRTGDVAKYHADGSIEFLGRSDFQVKIRGFRIEMGEIESVLSEHPQLAAVLVVAHKDDRNVNHLIAYLVPKSHPAPTSEDIQQYCNTHLPAYMVPECIIFMDEFPLSSNGKIDRKQLPKPTGNDFKAMTEYVAPRNPIEDIITHIWMEVLDSRPIGIYDNFFKIGGHSLLAAELAVKLQSALNRRIELRKLFEFPTIQQFSEFLETTQEVNQHVGPEMISVKKIEKKEYYDLAPAQIPEWYAYQLDKNSPVYNVSFNDLFFKGLNVEVFVQAWQAIFNRHSNFRIHFDYINGKPVQRLMSPIQIAVNQVLIDESHIPLEMVDEVASRYAYEYSNKAFDFDKGPLFVLNVVKYPDDQYQLLFVVHHIIWDETSTINLFTELAQIYNSMLSGEQPTLPQLTYDYFDYSEWINKSIQSGDFEKHRQYWLNIYKDAPPALDLPSDYPRPPMLTFNGDSVSSWIPRDTLRKLEHYIEKNNVTLFMFMMAIIDLYFFRITGQKDIVIGSPIAGRDHESFKPILGLFASPMPIRCQLEAEMTFMTLLQHVKDRSLAAYENHFYPCNLVIEELNHAKDLSRPKLFSVMYGVQNNKTNLYKSTVFNNAQHFLKDLYGAEANSARFDLTLVVDQWGSDIAFNCIYNTDIFKQTTVERMLNEMGRLIDEVIGDSNQQLTQYNFLDSAAQLELTVKHNQTDAKYPDISLTQLIENQVKKTPSAIAINYANQSLTYAELNSKANQLAHYLEIRGVKPGQPVGVLLQSSPNMIITLLAILKLSAHYVPISVEYPKTRIDYILSHADIEHVVSNQCFVKDITDQSITVISLDHDKEDIAIQPIDSPNFQSNHDSLVYIIYTSGTTGKPKGIPIQSRGVINLLTSTQRDYGLTESDKLLFLTPHTFDASVLDIFWPLANGASIVIPTAEVHKNPVMIANLINDKKVSVIQCVPLLLEALIDTHIKLDPLRLIISGGALLTRQLRDRFYQHFDCRLMNHYGPTEVTVDASRYDCKTEFDGDVVPIGYPIANTKIFILDAYHNLVQKGIVGEIYIASPGLTMGYMNDPEKNHQSFITKTFNNVAYRLYRSGDLGKLSDSGAVYYIGRIDKQVKVRGNRVELEEVDNAILQHSQIKNALVKYFAKNASDGNLVAYIELKADNNVFHIGQDKYYLFTIAQRPELMRLVNAAHNDAWPVYFEGSKILKEYWPRIYSEYPEFQFSLVTTDDHLAAIGNALPIYWDGNNEHVPAGWDAALVSAFEERTQHPNTLLILAGVVTNEFQGKGLSSEILNAFKSLAKGHHLEKIIVAVRPTGKINHPEYTFTEWCSIRRSDGQLADNWLRMHERIGGKFLKIALESQLVESTIQQWEQWSGQSITTSGIYELKDTLQAVEVNTESNTVRYFDPAVWMEHYLTESDDCHWVHIDKNELRQFLTTLLPAYMIPEQYYFIPELPLLESGKVNEKGLPEPKVTTALVHVPAKSEKQKQILAIWSNILKIESIGIMDDFFDLGGQSLKVIQMLSEVSNLYGMKIPLCKFYLSPTIKGLEEYIINSQLGKTSML